jgi:uncharacterized protein (TIGR03083 family)
MTDPYVLRQMVAAEQAEFATMLGELTPEQWAAPSLCHGWSVHDVVVHIAIHSHSTAPQRTARLARVGFSEHRQMAPDHARPTDELIDWLASPAKLAGPTNIRTQLSELVIHQQDVRRPLGIPRTIPPARLSVVLDHAVTRTGSRSIGNLRRRANGLRLIATDIAWTFGTGPEVRGAGEAIYMAINGRSDAMTDLSGHGTSTLASRIKS